MPANGAVEPKTGSEKISSEATNRLVSLVLDGGLSVTQALAIVTAERLPGIPSYSTATTAVRRARAERDLSADPRAIASRMLRILSAELGAIERSKGPKDLDRLAKLAQTLGQLDRLRPKAGKEEKEQALLDLIPDSPKERGIGDLSNGSEGAEPEEGVRSAQLR